MSHPRIPPRLSLPLVATLLLACDTGTSVEDIRDRIDPPNQYRVYWTLTQGCSGLERSFSGVKWYWTTSFPGRPEVVAQWNEKREITILFPQRGEQLVVMHEILHDLLRGDGDHESPLWGRCDIPTGNTGS